MSIQELKLVDSKKAKVDLNRASKFRIASGRRNDVRKILGKARAKVSFLGENVNLTNDTEIFEFILENIRNSVSLEDKRRFINKAEQAIVDFKKSYDKILSDVNLSTEDRKDIKNNRDDLALEMQTRLTDVINEGLEETMQDEQEIAAVNNFEIPEAEVETRKEEKTMGLENDVRESLVNKQTYEEYIFDEIMKRKGADFDDFIKLVIEYFVKGTKIIGVYTLEEFIDERRRQIEKVEQRKIEDEKRKFERKYIDSENELKASSEKNDMLSRQRDEYREKVGSLRGENNILTQEISDQKHTISELERQNGELNAEVSLDKRNIAEQQRQIFDLQRRLDNEVDGRNQDGLKIRNLEEELKESMSREQAAEARINELNESTKKWRDKISAELYKLSPSADNKNYASDESDDYENRQAQIDLDKLSKGFEELSRVMNGAESVEEPQRVHVH